VKPPASASKLYGKKCAHSGGELTAKSIWNFMVAQKSLRDLAAKPLNASATEETRKTSRARPRGKKHRVGTHEVA
jgi:hypothetical protein